MTKDIGNNCVSCLKDTSFGFGRFVNRIPATTENYEGYLCSDCQMVDCDSCKRETLEYLVCNKTNKLLCEDCYDK